MPRNRPVHRQTLETTVAPSTLALLDQLKARLDLPRSQTVDFCVQLAAHVIEDVVDPTDLLTPLNALRAGGWWFKNTPDAPPAGRWEQATEANGNEPAS